MHRPVAEPAVDDRGLNSSFLQAHKQSVDSQ